jgi:hypothetical protein
MADPMTSEGRVGSDAGDDGWWRGFADPDPAEEEACDVCVSPVDGVTPGVGGAAERVGRALGLGATDDAAGATVLGSTCFVESCQTNATAPPAGTVRASTPRLA